MSGLLIKRLYEFSMKSILWALLMCVSSSLLLCTRSGGAAETSPSGLIPNSGETIEGNWRLVAAKCNLVGSDSCRVGLQPCPSFYVFDGKNIIRHETSYSVTCTPSGCDTTIHCYSAVSNPYSVRDDSTITAWGDRIQWTIKSDTLLLVRHMESGYPSGTQSYWFVRESIQVPYGKPPCACQ